MEKDPVCGMQVDPNGAAARREVQGRTYYFCSQGCAAKFDQSPQQYLKTSAPAKPPR
jgi:Cu+-exporting ATPase